MEKYIYDSELIRKYFFISIINNAKKRNHKEHKQNF